MLFRSGLFRHAGMTFTSLAENVRQIDDSRPIHLLDTPDICRTFTNGLSDVFEKGDSDQKPEGQFEFGSCYYQVSSPNKVLLRELRQALRPVYIEVVHADSGAFLIKNNYNWISTEDFYFDWRLLKNGQLILAGELDNVRAEPGGDCLVELMFGDQTFDDGSEYILRFEAVYANSSLWATCGEEAFFQEFTLAQAERPDLEAPTRSGGRLRLESDRHHLIVSGSRFWLVFNRINGSLESWRVGEKELIAARIADTGSGLAGLQPAIWRVTDILDSGWLPEWHQMGFDRVTPQVISCQEGCDGQSAVIEMVIRLAAIGKPAYLEAVIRYDVRSIGDLRVFASLKPLMDNLPPVPCFGFALNLSKDFDQVSWLGGGPLPGLYSLHGSPRRGIYDALPVIDHLANATQDDVTGIYPDVDWLQIKEQNGLGLMVRAGSLFGFSACPLNSATTLAGMGSLAKSKKSLMIQLFHTDHRLENNRPIKATWHFYLVVSSNSL